jgi:CPA2 family monovalent cation:H+ antiporter-2
MHDSHAFLHNMAVILCVAAVTTVLFQKLKQQVVLGYLLAGFLVGPHGTAAFAVEPAFAQTLSELGVILLMFSLGLEFSLRKLLKVGATSATIAVIECSLMLWGGYSLGRALGWAPLESVFTGALVAISSTTIIVRVFAEQKVRGRFTELVFGVLIVEDLIAILLLAVLTAVATGSGLTAGGLALVAGKLVAFLGGMLVVGLLALPRLMRFVLKLERPETTLVASVGLCFGMALLAQAFGYSVALGAFLGGALVAESGEAKQVEHLVQPVRDLFAAIFFVSVGMLIQPALIAEHWGAILALSLLVVVGKVTGVSLASFLTGGGIRSSVQTGMSLAQIGEFSFIIAGVGLSLGATGRHLYPVAVAVSVLTTALTPFLIRSSEAVATLADRKLPGRVQTFVALYGSWVEQLGRTHRKQGTSKRERRLAGLLLLDAACIAGVLIGTSLMLAELVSLVSGVTGLSAALAEYAVVAGASVLALPFLVGMARCARAIGEELALEALPAAAAGRADLAAAPRRALTVTLQLAILLLVGVPLVALTQPFLPAFRGAAVLVLWLAVLGLALWRSTTNLHGHVRAGAQVLTEVLSRQAQAAATTHEAPHLEAVHKVLPGLGDPLAVRLEAGSSAVGKTLAELNVRGLTGATVLAISRGEGEVLVPTGKEELREGDLLALAGTHAAVDAARELLCTGGTAAELAPSPAVA